MIDKGLRLVFFIFVFMTACTLASKAQIVNSVPFSQDDLLKENPDKQGQLLAQIIQDSHSAASKHCDTAQATFKKAYKEGSGGWLVHCSPGGDQWVLVPSVAGKGAVTMSCELMKAMTGGDCYNPN